MRRMRIAHPALLALTAVWVLACEGPEPRIVLFGEEVPLAEEIALQGHDRGFLDVIGVDELHYNAARELTSEQMGRVTSALLSGTSSPAVDPNVILALVYTGDTYGSTETITRDITHGFSTFSVAGERLVHRYFERQGATFTEVPSLGKELDGGFSFDDIRMLHFAAIGEAGLPAKSTIYEFRARSGDSSTAGGRTDRSLRLALLLDNQRFWGAPTSGLYGEEIQAALMAPQEPGGGGGFCGFVNPGPPQIGEPTDPGTGCPQGKDPCYQDPRAGMKMFCTKDTGCFAAMASTLVANGRPDDAATIDFRRLWRFQDEFLLRHPIGRDYVAAYLVASLFLKLDAESMQQSLDVLPHAYRAMDILTSGDTDETVVTEELFAMMSALFDSVRGIENPIYQRVLDRLQRDLSDFRGLTRGELIREFERRPSVSLATTIVVG